MTETLNQGNMLIGVTLDERKNIPNDAAVHIMSCGEGTTMMALPEVLNDAVAATLPRGFIILQVKNRKYFGVYISNIIFFS